MTVVRRPRTRSMQRANALLQLRKLQQRERQAEGQRVKQALRTITAALSLLLMVPAFPAQAARIEELCDIQGVRANQLIGYGLVVGLNRTGDRGQARFTMQSTAAMLRRLGANVDPRLVQTQNAAAVMVTATLPAFAPPGTRIDVTVSSLGNARSLQGGTLLQTPLYGGDRQIYAVAQGSLILGGFSAGGFSGSSVSNNHVTAGRVPNGAIVERAVPMPGLGKAKFTFALKQPSFVTAQRIAIAINDSLKEASKAPEEAKPAEEETAAAEGTEEAAKPEEAPAEEEAQAPKVARALDSGRVQVDVPEALREDVVELIANLQLLEVDPDIPARVVVDERTGTVVLGSGVRISEVAIAQGGLTVEITETPVVSQPNAPFSDAGQTAVVPRTEIKAEAQKGPLVTLKQGASLSDVVAALNAIGAKPRDMIAIFQALKASGALQADLEVQ